MNDVGGGGDGEKDDNEGFNNMHYSFMIENTYKFEIRL